MNTVWHFIALFTFAALASFEILMPLGSAFLHIGQVIASAERVTDIIEQQPLVAFNGKAEFDQNATTLLKQKIFLLLILNVKIVL